MLHNSGKEITSSVCKIMMIQDNSTLIHGSETIIFSRFFKKNVAMCWKKTLYTCFPGLCVYMKRVVTCDI